MRIYFSGGGGLTDTPEVLIPEHKPHVMLTYHNIDQGQSATIDRLNVFLRRKGHPDYEAPKKKKKKS